MKKIPMQTHMLDFSVRVASAFAHVRSYANIRSTWASAHVKALGIGL